jgi:hypothetical protein
LIKKRLKKKLQLKKKIKMAFCKNPFYSFF